MRATLLLLLTSIFAINSIAQVNNGIAKETIITLADGTEVNIEKIKKDDLLLTLKEDGSSIEVSRVVDILEVSPSGLVKVTLANGAQITVTPNHPLLSEKGWASADSKSTQQLNEYTSGRIQPYKVDSFIYTLSTDAKIEILPIIEIENITTNTPMYKLILETPVAYIANGIFIGQ